LANK